MKQQSFLEALATDWAIMIKEEKNQLIIILFVVFLSFIGASIAYPIIPPLFLQSTDSHIIPLGWSDTTRQFFLGLTLAIFPLGQFIGAPILGRNADLHGRKEMLLLSLMGGIFAYILTALSLYIESLTLLLFSRFLSGFMESTFPIARAMASDLISINKFISFGRINTMAALGYILGPLFGGFFSDKNVLSGFAYPIPFLIAAIASFIALVLIYQTFPNQQKTLQKPQPPILQQFNLVHQFKHLFRSHPELKKLLLLVHYLRSLLIFFMNLVLFI